MPLPSSGLVIAGKLKNANNYSSLTQNHLHGSFFTESDIKNNYTENVSFFGVTDSQDRGSVTLFFAFNNKKLYQRWKTEPQMLGRQLCNMLQSHCEEMDSKQEDHKDINYNESYLNIAVFSWFFNYYKLQYNENIFTFKVKPTGIPYR